MRRYREEMKNFGKWLGVSIFLILMTNITFLSFAQEGKISPSEELRFSEFKIKGRSISPGEVISTNDLNEEGFLELNFSLKQEIPKGAYVEVSLDGGKEWNIVERISENRYFYKFKPAQDKYSIQVKVTPLIPEPKPSLAQTDLERQKKKYSFYEERAMKMLRIYNEMKKKEVKVEKRKIEKGESALEKLRKKLSGKEITDPKIIEGYEREGISTVPGQP